MKEVFAARIPHIYLLYGLAFFALGLALALELGRMLDSRFKRALRSLAIFGLVHGFHEWFEMFELIGERTYDFVPPTWLEWIRLVILAGSFITLCTFGVQMFRPSVWLFARNALMVLVLFYLLGVLEIGAWLEWSARDWIRAADVWSRYTLGIPGALLAAWGLLIQRRILRREGLAAYANGLVWAALAFALYGVVGQFVTGPSALLPSTAINTERFLNTIGIPIQLFRATMAACIAVFTIRALRAFDVNRRRQLAAAQQEAQEAIARRDALRGELLRHSVNTQEEERRRIARELHDEIGQMLTGLAAGLRGVQQSLAVDPERARFQLRQLEGMTARAIGELGQLVADLRPSLLDDMGLSAALDWYVAQVNQRGSTKVSLALEETVCRLSAEVETTLFRITQEALTNVLRHARADHAQVELVCENGLAQLKVCDDGVGFHAEKVLAGDVQEGWGLVGIQERVQLVGGECLIESAPGEGTTLVVKIPLLTLTGENDGSN